MSSQPLRGEHIFGEWLGGGQPQTQQKATPSILFQPDREQQQQRWIFYPAWLEMRNNPGMMQNEMMERQNQESRNRG